MADINERAKLYSEFEKNAMPPMDALYNYALRITGNKNKASRLLQETYKKAFWFFDKLDKSINIRDWLFRVMRNAFINKFSNQSKEMTESDYEEAEHFYTGLKSSSPDIARLEKVINNRITDEELSEILFSVPENLRIVIILCDIESFSYEEIADFVDVPVGTVISRLRRARLMLFTKLYQYAEKFDRHQ